MAIPPVPAVCLHRVDKLPEEDVAFSEELSIYFGEEVSKKYTGIVDKRKDVAKKLESLCFEAATEKDPSKLKFLYDHIDHMSALKGELDGHFDQLKNLFGEAHPGELAAELAAV